MGNCKDNMKPSSLTDTKKFGLFKSKRQNADNKDTEPPTFADVINDADEMLGKLIAKKEAELQTETGNESKNRVSLSILRSMSWHLDQIIENAVEYTGR